MAKAVFNKKTKRFDIKGLTIDELYIIQECIRNVRDCMSWDDSEGAACDGERFIMQLEKSEFEVLKKIEF